MPYAGDPIIATALPAEVTAYGNGANTISSTSFAVLPTNTATASITNSSTIYNLKIFVLLGCYMVSSTQTLTASIAASGGITISPGIGSGGAIGNGELLSLNANANPVSMSSIIPISIPPSVGAVTFTWYAMCSSNSGTLTLSYPTTRLLPPYYY